MINIPDISMVRIMNKIIHSIRKGTKPNLYYYIKKYGKDNIEKIQCKCNELYLHDNEFTSFIDGELFNRR